MDFDNIKACADAGSQVLELLNSSSDDESKNKGWDRSVRWKQANLNGDFDSETKKQHGHYFVEIPFYDLKIF